MSNHLVPCPACDRHVRAAEPACPFCQAEIPLALRAQVPRIPTRRLTRAATFAFGAALATAGCDSAGGMDASTSMDAQVQMDAQVDAFVGAFDAAYGAPPFDAGPTGTDAGPTGTDAGPTGVDAGEDGGLVALYGGAPTDAATDAGRDAGIPIAPAYGGPSLIDAG